MGAKAARRFEAEIAAKRAKFEDQRRKEAERAGAAAGGGGRGDAQREGMLMTCQVQLNLLVFHAKSLAKSIALSNGLEHAVIQAVIIRCLNPKP